MPSLYVGLFALLFGCICAIVASTVHGAESGRGYWSRSEQGWFWYKDPPPAPDKKPEPPKVPAEAAAPAVPEMFSTKWMRENMERYRDAAIDNPTPANVHAYMYLQRLVMDKAEVFSHAMRNATYADNALNEGSRSPDNLLAKTAATQARSIAAKAVMTRLARSAGLWFFFRSDCPYCHAQVPVLHALENLYGFTVLPISLDNQPLPGGEYPNWVADQGQGAQLQVTVTPTLFLVAPPDRVLKIGSGVMGLDQFEDRLIELGHQAGWISEPEFVELQTFGKGDYLQNGLPSSVSGLPDDKDSVLALLYAAAHNGESTPLSLSTQPARSK